MYYTAIVFFKGNLKKTPLKYRNINNLEKFMSFVRDKWTDAIYYNLYDKKTKEFVRRQWLNSFPFSDARNPISSNQEIL
jgi:hypothetical protein